jgi:two-component system, OmpR family, KDP operon response regulator KdpE
MHASPGGARREETVVSTVLVVDDEDDIRILVRLALVPTGMDVVEASGGADAIAAIEAGGIDVVVLDLRMPGVDGFAVIDHLKAAGRLPGLPVLVLSAHADNEVATRLLDSGCAGFMRKPFGPTDLAAAVRLAGNPPPSPPPSPA